MYTSQKSTSYKTFLTQTQLILVRPNVKSTRVKVTLALTSNTGISRESVQKVVSCVHRAGIIELQQRFYHGRDSYATEESKLI